MFPKIRYLFVLTSALMKTNDQLRIDEDVVIVALRSSRLLPDIWLSEIHSANVGVVKYTKLQSIRSMNNSFSSQNSMVFFLRNGLVAIHEKWTSGLPGQVPSVIRRRKVWWIRFDNPFQCFQICFGRFRYMWPSVAMLQNHFVATRSRRHGYLAGPSMMKHGMIFSAYNCRNAHTFHHRFHHDSMQKTRPFEPLG